MIAALILGAAVLQGGAEEAPWVPGAERFEDAKACSARLGTLAGEMLAAGEHEIVRGPYEIGAGDVRFHAVKPEGSGHRISEYRCLANEFSSRSWTHSMEQGEAKSWLESAAERLNESAAKE